jgi:TolB protein
MTRLWMLFLLLVAAAIPALSCGIPLGDAAVSGAGSSTPLRLTNESGDQMAPAIDGNLIAWLDDRDGSARIYLYAIDNATAGPITNNASSPLWLDISDGTVVWQDNRSGDWEIYLYNSASGIERRLTNESGDQVKPAINGDRVVWLDARTGEDGGIYLANLTTSAVMKVSTGPVEGDPLLVSPDVSDRGIVWADNSSGNYTIYAALDPALGPRSLANGAVLQAFPAISADRIVWTEGRDGRLSLVLHNLTTGREDEIVAGDTMNPMYPDISGDLVVWQDFRGDGTDDIYLLDIRSENVTRLTDDNAIQMLPKVSRDRIVWMDNRSGDWDIFLYTLGNMTASQYTFGEAQNGQNVTVPEGNEVIVRLPENPTTGYSWNVTVSPGLAVTGDRYEPNSTSGMLLGGGGIHTWSLVPEHPGIFTFSGIYMRPWENVTGTEERYTLTITTVESTGGSH